MSIPYDDASTEDTTVGATDLDETQDDTTLDDPGFNDDAIQQTFLGDDSDADGDSAPEEREDVPATDAHAIDADQPGTQNDDSLVEAALGEDGQGDLAPEDEEGAGQSDDGPEDLRTSI